MDIHNHKKVTSTIYSAGKNALEFKYCSIDEFADQIVDIFITSCEEEYTKDPMTNGYIPCAELIKAVVRIIQFNEDLGENEDIKIAIDDILDRAEGDEKHYSEYFKNLKD